MYNENEIDNEILIYMRRHFDIVKRENEFSRNTVSIYIDGKSRFLNSNKKRLKNKIYEIIENKFPHSVKTKDSSSKVMKTIKCYIDEIRLL